MRAHWLVVCCAIALAANRADGDESAKPKIERSTRCMGTEFTITACGRNLGQLEAAFDEAHRLDALLSNYLPDSELSRVNRQASGRAVKISPEIFDFLDLCVRYSRASEGSFDITVDSLMKVWGFYKGSGHLPHGAEIAAALQDVGYQNIRLDRAEGTVAFSRPGLTLDPGGVGKGLAVDRMTDILRQYGVESALVSGGGSSIYGLGAPPDDPRGWAVRIRDARDEKKTAARVFLKDRSLSTSGNYEKFFWAEGRLYSHIMDPRTGYPAQGMLAVSVISPKTIDSEIWAKPYYILGKGWAAQHKGKDFQILVCEDKPGVNCEWLR